MTDHDIDKHYKKQATQMPPISVDIKITELAQQSVQQTKAHNNSNKLKTYFPLSLVASIMLVGLLILNFPANYQSPPVTEESFEPVPTQAEKLLGLKPLSPQADTQPLSTLPENNQQIHHFSDTTVQKARLAKQARAKILINPAEKARLIEIIREHLQRDHLKDAKLKAALFEKRYGKNALPDDLHYLLAKPAK